MIDEARDAGDRLREDKGHIHHLLLRDDIQQAEIDAQKAFTEIKVDGQDPIVAVDHMTDIQLAVTGNATITTNTEARSITIDVSALGTGDQNVFSNVAVSGQTTLVAGSLTDTLAFAAGAGVTITTTPGAGPSADTVTHGLTDMAQATFKGRAAGAGTGAPVDLTAAQAKTILDLAGTNTGDQTITLSSDVAGSGTGAITTTIQPGVVTFAKMQAVSADVLLGNDSSGTAVQEIACTAAGRALLDDPSASDQRSTLGLGTLATQSGTFSGTHSGTSSGTNTGDQTISLTGDVTAAGGPGVLTTAIAAGVVDTTELANKAVTLAKMADMATDSFLGRDTAGDGAPEVLSVATAKGLLGLSGTNTGDQTITLTGDVTGSGTGTFAATIPAGSIEYAQLQNMVGSSKLLGSGDSGAGANPVEITLGTNLSMSGTTLNAAGGGGNAFGHVAVSGQTTLDADAAEDTLTMAAGTNIAITTTVGSDTVTIATTGLGSLALKSSVDAGDINCAANKLIGNDASGTVAQELDCTSAGRALLDDTDAAAQRTTLGLGTLATASTITIPISMVFRGGPPVTGTVVGFRAPKSMTITNLRGYREGGTGATINAIVNSSNVRASDLSIGSASTWTDGGSLATTEVASGDSVKFRLVSVTGSVTCVIVQIDVTAGAA